MTGGHLILYVTSKEKIAWSYIGRSVWPLSLVSKRNYAVIDNFVEATTNDDAAMGRSSFLGPPLTIESIAKFILQMWNNDIQNF